MKKSAIYVLGFATLLAASGCSKSSSESAQAQPPIAGDVEQQVIATGLPSADPNASSSVSVRVRVNNVDRDAILNQEFLYGADLQYSSSYDKDMDLYNQSIALGHIPVHFVIAGDELELIADNRRSFPSANNHPEQLISRFKILAQNAKTLTISGFDSRVFLGELFSGVTNPNATTAVDPAGQPPRDHWIRSLDYVREGNYLLQQTSVILADGSIAEFMESVFPRRTLEPGADFQRFDLDPDSPTGSRQPGDLMDRFRFLPGETTFEIGPQFSGGERKVAYGQHFDLSGGKTIDWYVTPNISDESLAPVQQAVEGWNRYFTKYKGIARDVMRFRGRLPEGIHIGDPRFNVINWDSRLVAGAAYETQASDPNTGRQSHSLIYMPAAWLQIGQDYWKQGQYSESHPESVAPHALASRGILGRARVACLRDVRDAAALLASGRLTADETKVFAVRLLKQTLFHEVGHSLGLAHNFKGSLAFDRSNPNSLFSTSIMDYNDFEIERGAFYSVDTFDGPQLEYDRQAIDAIYNRGKDIKSTDPIVPACNDAEADHEGADGVDPLCMRYDIEHDPTHAVVTALSRIQQATLAGDVTLAQAVKNAQSSVLTAEALAAVRTQDDLEAISDRLATALSGALKFYVISGKASLSREVRMNLKSLLVFEDGVLPSDYSERAMRERAFGGVQQALSFKKLPDVVKAALADAEAAALPRLAATPFMQGLAAADAQHLNTELKQTLDSIGNDFESRSLPKLRTAVLTTLARHNAVPFFLGELSGAPATDIAANATPASGAASPASPSSQAQADYETAIVGLLADATVDHSLTSGERVAAATSLVSFAHRLNNDAAISAATTEVTSERAGAASNQARETVEAILAALGGSAGSN